MKKVTSARLHEVLHVVGVGNLPNPLHEVTNQLGTVRNLSMEYDGQNLYITVNGVKLFTPSANIKSAVLGSEK